MDEYLKLCWNKFAAQKPRPYIKQELQDHMEDQIAENMKAGMDHEQAEKEAVRDMGDPVETGISLDSNPQTSGCMETFGNNYIYQHCRCSDTCRDFRKSQ